MFSSVQFLFKILTVKGIKSIKHSLNTGLLWHYFQMSACFGRFSKTFCCVERHGKPIPPLFVCLPLCTHPSSLVLNLVCSTSWTLNKSCWSYVRMNYASLNKTWFTMSNTSPKLKYFLSRVCVMARVKKASGTWILWLPFWIIFLMFNDFSKWL